MSFENLLDGLPGRELLKDQLNRDARARNDRFAHHHMRVRLNQLRLHNSSDYTLNAHKPRATMILLHSSYSEWVGRGIAEKHYRHFHLAVASSLTFSCIQRLSSVSGETPRFFAKDTNFAESFVSTG